jgi:anaerobic selenocysteine-containing dehydrogenase
VADYKEFLQSVDRKAYHEGEYQWEEDGYTVTRSNHWSPPGCHNSCGFLLYVKDGKLEKIEGDPLSPWANGKLCVRCLDMVESCNDPMRLKYPMLRDGERGENKWKRISWDEAYDLCVEKIRYYQENFGNETVSVAHGTGRNINWQIPYLGFVAFKTPTVCTQYFTGISCYLPRLMAGQASAGDYFIVDASMTHEDRYANAEWRAPEVAIIWGNEPLRSNADGYLGHWLVQCVQMGTKLISVDPRLTWWGARSEYFLQIRPATDAALAMAMLNVIIAEDLYDHDFVEEWCAGFEQLAEAVKDSTPEWAAEVCWIDAEDIRGAARLYGAARPGTIQWGLPFEQQASAMGLDTAVMDLLGICGNIDVPGGVVLVRNAFNIPTSISEDYLDKDILAKRIVKPRENFPWGDTRDMMFAQEANASNAQKMLWVQSSNPIACPGLDAPRVYDCLKQHEFVVVCDPYITPTAVACGDLLLPVAMSPERNSIRSWWTPVRVQLKACEYYEAKSDEQIIVEIGKRLNPEGFPWDDDLGFLEWYLRNEGPVWLGEGADDSFHSRNKNTGEDFELFDSMYNFSGERWEGTFMDIAKKGCYAYDHWNTVYRKYEKGMLRSDGEKGFGTATGKFELVTNLYAAWGMHPAPYFVEPYQSPVATPDLYKRYPLIMVTGGRSFEFFHSENRQLETMRELHPWPLVQVNPLTAERFGVQDGQWIWIENDMGRFKQLCSVTPVVKDGVIHVEHGWWFPEQEGAEPHLFGTFDSNPNNCIPGDVTGPYGIAAPVKNMLARIYSVEEGDTTPGTQVCDLGGFEIQKARREAYMRAWQGQ